MTSDLPHFAPDYIYTCKFSTLLLRNEERFILQTQ